MFINFMYVVINTSLPQKWMVWTNLRQRHKWTRFCLCFSRSTLHFCSITG